MAAWCGWKAKMLRSFANLLRLHRNWPESSIFVPSNTLHLPPLCTSTSGLLRGEVLVPSSQAEWLQTGRTGPSAEVVCCCCWLWRMLVFLSAACFSVQLSSPELNSCFIAIIKWGWTHIFDHLYDLMQHATMKDMMLIVCLYGNFRGQSLFKSI